MTDYLIKECTPKYRALDRCVLRLEYANIDFPFGRMRVVHTIPGTNSAKDLENNYNKWPIGQANMNSSDLRHLFFI